MATHFTMEKFVILFYLNSKTEIVVAALDRYL